VILGYIVQSKTTFLACQNIRLAKKVKHLNMRVPRFIVLRTRPVLFATLMTGQWRNTSLVVREQVEY
jgi:ribosomal protein L39E